MQGYNLTLHIINRMHGMGLCEPDERMAYLAKVTGIAQRMRELESVPVARWNQLTDGAEPDRSTYPIPLSLSARVVTDGSGSRLVPMPEGRAMLDSRDGGC